MSAAEVHTVLDTLATAGCRAWIGGGWGVDALAGHQTRQHRDLDLAIPADCETAALKALAEIGYQVETDWRPVRVEVAAPRGRVDLHPLTFDAAGDGHQAGLDGQSFLYPKDCFTTGTITDRQVDCLSIDQQLRFHSGYEPRDIDRADLELLHQLAAKSREQDSVPVSRADESMAFMRDVAVGAARVGDPHRPLGRLCGWSRMLLGECAYCAHRRRGWTVVGRPVLGWGRPHSSPPGPPRRVSAVSYPQPPPYVVMQSPPSSGWAVASLVFGVIGLFTGWCLLGIPCLAAVVMGHVGMAGTKSGRKSGRGMAVAGLVMGYVGLAPAIIVFFWLGVGGLGAILPGTVTTPTPTP